MNETIILTPEIAARFLLFQENYDLFVALQEGGVFDITHGKATLNFANSTLQNIVVEKLVYKNGLVL